MFSFRIFPFSIDISMFPCDRFGLVHVSRIAIEISLIIVMHIYGSCRFGIIFGFNNTSSIVFSLIIVVMLSMDIYYLLLAIFTSNIVQVESIFHIAFYALMSLLALICCVVSIVALFFCMQGKYNPLCTDRSCGIISIGIALTFLLTIAYSSSSKMICCARGKYQN